MKFTQKFKKTDLFNRSSHHSRKKLSNRDLSIKINEVENSKKKFRFPFIKNFTWSKKSTVKLQPLVPIPSPRIEELENEFMIMLKQLQNKSKTQNYQQAKHSTLIDRFNLNNSIEKCNQYQTKFHAKKRLMITRSLDDFPRTLVKHYLYPSLSSQPIHQSLLKNTARQSSHSNTSLTTIPRYRIEEVSDCSMKSRTESSNKNLSSKLSCLKKQNSPTNRKLSLHWDENSLKSTSKHHEAAIIEVDHQSSSSSSSTTNFSKLLEKSHSSPLPINTNHSSISNNHIQSAHLINQYQYKNNSRISLYSCVSEMGDNQSMESDSSDEDKNVKRTLLQYQDKINNKSLRHRWSLFDIWETTMNKLPPILNCIWRQRLHRTGSREFLLEYDQTLPTNNNNNNRANLIQEQRYVEQERPINSHIGLALLALLIFPPIGILAIILSIWSLCGQQDRHLSRKFGNAVYWISILAILLSFLLLFTLLTYFTYQYLINQYQTHHPLTNASDNT